MLETNRIQIFAGETREQLNNLGYSHLASVQEY